MWRTQELGTPITRGKAIEKLKPLFAELLGEAVFQAALNESEQHKKDEADLEAAIDEFILIAKKCWNCRDSRSCKAKADAIAIAIVRTNVSLSQLVSCA